MLTMTIAENQSKCNPKLSFRNYQKMRSYPSIPIFQTETFPKILYNSSNVAQFGHYGKKDEAKATAM